MQLTIAKLSKAIVNAVKNLPFATDVVQSGNTLSIDLKTREDVRPQVSQEITNAGGIIISMSLQRQNLEDVFMQLVGKQQGGKA